MSKLTHLGTCRMMKASTLGAILKLTKKSRYSGMSLCVNRPKGVFNMVCRLMKVRVFREILKLNSKSKVGAILQCMKK